MGKKKGRNYILIDPFKDIALDRIFNDLKEHPVTEYKAEIHGNTWQKVSVKISKRCDNLIDNGLMNPISTNRWRRSGFVSIPKGVSLKFEPIGKKKKILFKKKMF